MTKNEKPQIDKVIIGKVGRFWQVSVDGKLLSVVLYKCGAQSVQELIQRLAGLPVASDADKAAEPKTSVKAGTKPNPAVKNKNKVAAPGAKSKPPVKRAEVAAKKPETETAKVAASPVAATH